MDKLQNWTSSHPTQAADGMIMMAFESFERAEATWRVLERTGDAHVYQTYDWLEGWHRHVGTKTPIELCLLAVLDGGERPLMLLPLAIERRRHARVLTWLGSAFADYQAPVLAAHAAPVIEQIGMNAIWQELLGAIPRFDYADFDRQPQRIGRQANPFRQLDWLKCGPSAHHTCLTGDWESYYRTKRSKKTRHNDRRKRRKLEGVGQLEVVWGTTDQEIERLVAVMIQQKSAYAERQHRRNLLEEAGYAHFLCERAKAGVNDRSLALCGIALDGDILAVQWGPVHRRRLYSVVASYGGGPQSGLSPGEVLLHELFGWCFDRGIEIFDFTFGDEPYKMAWCEHTEPLYRSLIAHSVWGTLWVRGTLAWMKVKLLIRKSQWLMQCHRLTSRQFYRIFG